MEHGAGLAAPTASTPEGSITPGDPLSEPVASNRRWTLSLDHCTSPPAVFPDVIEHLFVISVCGYGAVTDHRLLNSGSCMFVDKRAQLLHVDHIGVAVPEQEGDGLVTDAQDCLDAVSHRRARAAAESLKRIDVSEQADWIDVLNDVVLVGVQRDRGRQGRGGNYVVLICAQRPKVAESPLFVARLLFSVLQEALKKTPLVGA